MQFAAQLEEKAKWLNKNGEDKSDDDDADKWTAQRVQLCLYAAAHDAAETPKKSTTAASKPTSKAKTKVAKSSLPIKCSSKITNEEEEEEVERTRKRRRTAATKQ